MEDAQKISQAVTTALNFRAADFDKGWVIDQMLKSLLGDDLAVVAAAYDDDGSRPSIRVSNAVISGAVAIALDFGRRDNDKAWVIDEMLKVLLGDSYETMMMAAAEGNQS